MDRSGGLKNRQDWRAEKWTRKLMTIHKALYARDDTYYIRFIGLVGRVFANGPGDLGSIPGRVTPKTLKWHLISPCLTLSIIRCVSTVKWSKTENGVAPSPMPRCSSYRKGSFRVTLTYGLRLYFHLYMVPSICFHTFCTGI